MPRLLIFLTKNTYFNKLLTLRVACSVILQKIVMFQMLVSTPDHIHVICKSYKTNGPTLYQVEKNHFILILYGKRSHNSGKELYI
jgi:hypothetical protein